MPKEGKKILLPAGILILAIGLSIIFVDQFLFASIEGLESNTPVLIVGLIASFLGGGLIVASYFRN